VVTVVPLALTGVAVSPPSVTGGTSSTGTVMISRPAPSGGVTLTLSGTGTAVVPATVSIPAGAASATFTVTTSRVSTATPVTISAAFSGATKYPAGDVGVATGGVGAGAVAPGGAAKNSGVTRTATLIVNPAAAALLRVDSGSATAYTDSLGNVWSADQYATGGMVDAPAPAPTVTNTADPTLYQTQRVEATAGTAFTYTLPVANGTYNLGLLFAEIDGKTKGQRVFNVTANGTALLTGFDIFAAAGGANKAVAKGFLVTVTTGQISLVFTGTTGQAAVSAVSVIVPGGGTYAADAPAPGWAEDVIPADQSDAGGAGPSASLSVSLPSGVLENRSGPDLDVFNPLGPGVSYSRMYRSALAAAGIYTPGLSPGWRDNYSLSVTSQGGGAYTLNYPNGAAEGWTTMGATISAPSGAPYLVAASGPNLTMTFKDYSSYTFTPDPNNGSNFLLTGLSNLAGSAVTIARDAANGSRMTALSNGAGPLLTFSYSGPSLAGIADAYGRAVTYGFTGGNLTTVSQVNAPNSVRWQYGYTAINSRPFLNAVMVPDPSSGGMSEADPQYTPDGHVAMLRDAESNERTYTYGPQGVSVSVYGPDNALSQAWTQKFDPANHNVDKGVIDAFGNATNLAYGDSANPMKVTAATNKNGQTATASFDRYGNAAATVDLRGVQTQVGYDAANPLSDLVSIAPGFNQARPKTTTTFTYYDGVTQVGGVTQPKHLIKTMSVPTPGTAGTGAQVQSTFVYTALGNAYTVSSPGPNTSGGTVTTAYNYTSDSAYDANGNPGTYTTSEKLRQPLTVTDPLGNVSHFRYDPRGNVVTVITPAVVSYPDTATARGLRTDYSYNQNNQITQVTYPATNPATPAARAYDVHTYEYDGGPLLAVTSYDEGGNPVRQANKGDGKEGEQKAQSGSVTQANLSYDPQYKLKQLVDGNINPAQNLGYDAVSNLTAQTYALGDGNQFAYDKDHNLMAAMDGRSITTTVTRAADDSRTTGLSYSDGTPSVTIGANGYDVYDRVVSFSDGAGSYSASYDDQDNLLAKTTTYAGLPPATVSYTYNNNGSVATMTTPKALSGGAYAYWTFTYGYDANGRLTAVTCPWAKSATSSGLAVLNYYYDEVGRLLKQHTLKADTFYVYNARSWVTQQESANSFFASSFTEPSTPENGYTGHPEHGTVPSRTAQGISISGDTNYCLLDNYYGIQYDSQGNRTQMGVNVPDLYQYNSSGTNLFSFGTAPDLDGTLSYAWDAKNRITLDTTYLNGSPTFEDYSVSGGGTLYNDNWNYPTAADPADNITTFRGSAQNYNADDQLTTETYDGAGDQTSYNGGSLLYDAEMRPISVAAGAGTTPFTQLFAGDGDRAWKLPSGGSKTYYLYDADGHVLCELNSAGGPVNTYAYGANGLLERFQHTNSGVPYLVYLFDPNGNPVHRVRSIDPNTSSGDAVFAQDTVLYDSQGLLRADIDTITGGFNRSHLDPVGFQGQSGSYTDTETLHAAAGLYAALSGPGGIYYSPESGVGMARSRADAANTYDQLLHPFDGWTFGAYAHEAGQFGIGEAKGTLNFVAGTAVSLSPELMLLDEQTGGRLSEPIATTGTQAAGSGFIQPVLFVATFFVDPEEVVALGGKGAKVLGGVGRGPTCFVAGTLVQMADGTTEPIERVREGDLVKSRNAKTGKVEAKRVDRTYVRVAPQVVTLTFTDAQTHQAQAFTCTPEHPFYVDGKGFVKAGDLGIGTSIVTRAGPVLTLSAAAWGALPAPATGLALGGGNPGGSRVYNLRVEDDHSYFVGTLHGGTCVHNADYPIVSHIVYTIRNRANLDEVLYVGKASAPGTPVQALARRFGSHKYKNVGVRRIEEVLSSKASSQGAEWVLYHRYQAEAAQTGRKLLNGNKPLNRNPNKWANINAYATDSKSYLYGR